MLIVCPNCATSYRIEPSSLGAAGRSVRCVRCRSVWVVHESAELPATEELARDGGISLSASFAALDDPRDPSDPPFGARDHATAEPSKPEPSDPAARDGVPVPLRIGEHGIPPIAAPTLDEDIETFVARRSARKLARRRNGWTLPGLPTAIAALVVANIILIACRTGVVKILPQTASLYAAIGLPVNLRGLSFDNVASTTEIDDGAPVLVVEGTIASAGNRTVEVPRLRFSVRNQRGQEVYAWTELPSRSVLPPGESLAFRSRLASPPADAHDLTVRFFNRRDRIAGLQEGG
jgi:predicted Zn finger-like uncharacterized protein